MLAVVVSSSSIPLPFQGSRISIYDFVYLTRQLWGYLPGSRCRSPERPTGGAVQQRPVGGQDLRQRGAE